MRDGLCVSCRRTKKTQFEKTKDPYVIIRTARGDFMVGTHRIIGQTKLPTFKDIRTLSISPDLPIQELATRGLPSDSFASAAVDLQMHEDNVREYVVITSPEVEAAFRALPTKPWLWGPNDRGDAP